MSQTQTPWIVLCRVTVDTYRVGGRKLTRDAALRLKHRLEEGGYSCSQPYHLTRGELDALAEVYDSLELSAKSSPATATIPRPGILAAVTARISAVWRRGKMVAAMLMIGLALLIAGWLLNR